MSADLSSVAVVGLGRIGLPLAAQYASRGLEVTGCDIDPSLVEQGAQGGRRPPPSAPPAVLPPPTLVIGDTPAPAGTTRNRLGPLLERSGLRVGRDILLAY